jgi:hypothetical protein
MLACSRRISTRSIGKVRPFLDNHLVVNSPSKVPLAENCCSCAILAVLFANILVCGQATITHLGSRAGPEVSAYLLLFCSLLSTIVGGYASRAEAS